MQLSIGSNLVGGDVNQKLQAIQDAGFRTIHFHKSGSLKDIHQTAKIAKGIGLTISSVCGFNAVNGLSSSREKTKAIEADLKRIDPTAANTIVVTPELDHNPDLQKDLETFVSIVKPTGKRVAILPLPWSKNLSSISQSIEIIDAIDDPKLGYCLNSCAVLIEGRQANHLRQIPVERVFHVELVDASKIISDLRRSDQIDASLPGQGDLNLGSFVRVLAKMGYQGTWSISDSSGQLLTAGAKSTDAFRSLVAILDDVARHEPALEPPLDRLPARVYPSGIEFLEFAVSDQDALEIAKILEAMCFRRERRHISKKVTLWRQGAINLVLNAEDEGHAFQARTEHGPCVCDMGLRVSDAAQTFNRAKALGTARLLQKAGVGELSIPAIKSVGGSVVHFIDEKSDLHRVWDIEFEPVSKTKSTPPAGLRRIDHIAQTMAYDDMQSWLTYYTSTFEFEKTAIQNVNDPSGIVLSQALASPEGEVRLNLNGAQGHKTFADSFLANQAGAGVQHLAFRTDDIFETSLHLQNASFDRLEIPQSYYEVTQAKFKLEDAFIAALADGHILYDEDAFGSYFQFYSKPLFDGFFFEIVERQGGYKGYGARNAPVRLKAQNLLLNGREK